MTEKCCNKHPNHKNNIPNLNRALGQLNSINNMIEEQKYCIDIITQLKAVQGALRNIELNILEKHLEQCTQIAFNSNNQKEIDLKIKEIIKIMKKN